ncbi:hypothetical protein NHP200010_11550 [Helicobacter bizzozeronii]|uniref:hypothetical protein n=1 Tax=Helicobacter bizzozeronii TaxID=56877 RepID=UPI00244D85B3|nr:hypothetical protein [Helicobacter bizzozeronii]GMB93436.1 hypothetical protein NHP200010_11550 [Helicobacter bizzozeronii]
MAVLYNANTTDWVYTNNTGKGLDLFITISGCAGEDRQYGENEREGNKEVFYARGNTGASVFVVQSSGRLNLVVDGGEGSERMLRRTGRWESKRVRYFKNGWDRFWGKASYRTDTWWKWRGVQNQVKPTQSGQTKSFATSLVPNENIRISANSTFSLSVATYPK